MNRIQHLCVHLGVVSHENKVTGAHRTLLCQRQRLRGCSSCGNVLDSVSCGWCYLWGSLPPSFPVVAHQTMMGDSISVCSSSGIDALFGGGSLLVVLDLLVICCFWCCGTRASKHVQGHSDSVAMRPVTDCVG